jgi:hypothetical protein
MNAANKLELVSLGGTGSLIAGFRYDDSSTPAEAKTVATAAPLVPSQTREDRFSDGRYLVSSARAGLDKRAEDELAFPTCGGGGKRATSR